MLALSFCCLQRWHALGTLFFRGGSAGGDPDPDPEAAGGCDSAVDGPMVIPTHGQLVYENCRSEWISQKDRLNNRH